MEETYLSFTNFDTLLNQWILDTVSANEIFENQANEILSRDIKIIQNEQTVRKNIYYHSFNNE